MEKDVKVGENLTLIECKHEVRGFKSRPEPVGSVGNTINGKQGQSMEELS
ncbi:MAG: hypothetical protein ACLFVQ_13820 [Chitinispirillaceae bacterium]